LDARDRGPTLSSDGLTLISFSNRRGQDDLFFATRASLTSPWSEPVGLDALNTPDDEVFPALSGDGLSLFFSDTFVQASTRPGNLGGADLWVSMRPSLESDWPSPVNLGPIINGTFSDTEPAVSSDGRTLLFSSLDRPENLREGRSPRYDLWMSTRTDPTSATGWTPPVHLGPVVNSVYNDLRPSLSRDSLALYFVSDRPSPGRPELFCVDGRCFPLNNIWVSKRNSTSEPFGPPVSLGVYFLDLGTLVDPCIAPDGSTLFFATTGLASSPFPSGLANIWHIPVLNVPPTLLSISLTQAAGRP
jgi:hypothetical protein